MRLAEIEHDHFGERIIHRDALDALRVRMLECVRGCDDGEFLNEHGYTPNNRRAVQARNAHKNTSKFNAKVRNLAHTFRRDATRLNVSELYHTDFVVRFGKRNFALADVPM